MKNTFVCLLLLLAALSEAVAVAEYENKTRQDAKSDARVAQSSETPRLAELLDTMDRIKARLLYLEASAEKILKSRLRPKNTSGTKQHTETPSIPRVDSHSTVSGLVNDESPDRDATSPSTTVGVAKDNEGVSKGNEGVAKVKPANLTTNARNSLRNEDLLALIKVIESKIEYSSDNVNSSVMKIIDLLRPEGQNDVSGLNGSFTNGSYSDAAISVKTAKLLARLKLEKLQLLWVLVGFVSLFLVGSAFAAVRSRGCCAESGSYVLRTV